MRGEIEKLIQSLEGEIKGLPKELSLVLLQSIICANNRFSEILI